MTHELIKRIVIEGVLDDQNIEEGGCAWSACLSGEVSELFPDFGILLSDWSEEGEHDFESEHERFQDMVGKKLRVTIEVID